MIVDIILWWNYLKLHNLLLRINSDIVFWSYTGEDLPDESDITFKIETFLVLIVPSNSYIHMQLPLIRTCLENNEFLKMVL